MHAIEKLQAYYNYTKTGDIYRDVVGIILRNMDKIEQSTIYDVADLCFVSPTTVSRLSRKLGYQGFQDFKSDLVSAIKNYDFLNRYISLSESAKYDDMITAYLQSLSLQINRLKADLDTEKLTEQVKMIHDCEKISFYTCGLMFAESRFQCDLIMTGHACEIKTSVIDQMEDAKTLTASDLVIMVLPAVADSTETKDLMRRIRDHGAKIFLLTDVKYPIYRNYVDEMYCFDGVIGILDDYRFAVYINLLSIRYREMFIGD